MLKKIIKSKIRMIGAAKKKKKMVNEMKLLNSKIGWK